VVSLYLIWSKREFLTVAGHPRPLLGGRPSKIGHHVTSRLVGVAG